MIDSSKISLNFIKKLEYTGGYQGMRYMLRKESRDEDTVLTAYACAGAILLFQNSTGEKDTKRIPPYPGGQGGSGSLVK